MNKSYTSALTEEQIVGIIEYGSVLRGIHNRLVGEGYFLENRRTWNIFRAGKIIIEFEWEG